MSATGQFQFKIIPCCPENGTEAIINISGILSDGDTGVYTYIGSQITIPGTDVTLFPQSCYTVARLTNVGDVTDIPASSWTGYYENSRCVDPQILVECPDCNPAAGNYYIKAVPCCDTENPIYFKGEGWQGNGASAPQFSILDFEGVHLFSGFTSQTPINIATGLEVGQCYTFSFNSVSDPSSEITLAEYNNLPYPGYISQFEYVSAIKCNQLNPLTNAPYCPDCNNTCYTLTSCEGVIINTRINLEAYVGTYISLVGYPGQVWLVQINTGICQNPTLTLKINGFNLDACPCKCYEIIGASGGISYIDCDGKSQYTYGPAKFCAQAPPIVKGVEGVDYTLITGTDCIEGECVEKCYLLTNCDPTSYPTQDATLTSTLQTLSAYAGVSTVVELVGYEGCWSVEETTPCDCPIDVTVIRSHISCQDCIGTVAYKLTNCEKINEVVYTVQDFSAFVGKVIKDDCNCWSVERIDYQPPSQTTIVDPILYTDCTSCLTKYYQLDDCDLTSETPSIITSTNLAGYVDSVIQIDGCAGCYTVSVYDDLEEPAASQEVSVTSSFQDCSSCTSITPRCSTVFNSSTEEQIYTFINANGDKEQTVAIKSGQSSLRYCVQRWVENDTQGGIFNYYGDCNVFEDENKNKTGFCPQYFPNDRKVKPGYNTPICSADKYDKITCNFADIAYKNVLELRYGISDCCPEENEKWIIKKELIELQALTDPDYTCDPSTDCCNTSDNSSSCNS